MNCLEFRRRLGSEPESSFAAFIAHRDECAHCAAAQARAEEFEARIRRAISVPAPTDLADRILLAQTTEARQSVRNRRRSGVAAMLAVAASVVIGIIVVRSPQQAPPLSTAMVEHVQNHEVGAGSSGIPVPRQDVLEAFAARGVNLASIPDGISYVHQCPVGSYRTVHMVMPESSGSVSVLYVVDPPSLDRVEFERNGLHGRELPLGNGALVMLASDTRDFDAIENAWKTAMGESISDLPMPAQRTPGTGFAAAYGVIHKASIAAP